MRIFSFNYNDTYILTLSFFFFKLHLGNNIRINLIELIVESLIPSYDFMEIYIWYAR